MGTIGVPLWVPFGTQSEPINQRITLQMSPPSQHFFKKQGGGHLEILNLENLGNEIFFQNVYENISDNSTSDLRVLSD